MPYWLTNPDHGILPVYDMGEVERCKQFGWTLLNHGESPERAKPEIIALSVVEKPSEWAEQPRFEPTEWSKAVTATMRETEA